MIDGKRNISLVFICQSYFKVPKDIRLIATHYFIMQISNKRELQQKASSYSSGIFIWYSAEVSALSSGIVDEVISSNKDCENVNESWNKIDVDGKTLT